MTMMMKDLPAGEENKKPAVTRPFGKYNFICMGVCLAMIIIGFALMAGPGSSVEGGVNPDIFSTRRIVVGPLVAFLGFLLMVFAIIVKPATFERLLGKKGKEQ